MEQSKLDRISELTRIARERTLTPEESAERESLRREYLDGWRRGTEDVLEHTVVRDADGNIKKLERKEEQPQ
ncbi:MAG: DUF896 domain-containing protein [Firmicutes bacterium]|nr:DUF896 domain-containing protein [Bacillota bacterium]